MGGFFGAACNHDAMSDVFFGTDYHTHLGIKRGGMAAFDEEIGLQRQIKNIENAPFRTKFDNIFDEMNGKSAIGCISDSDPQPLLIRSKLGVYAICIVGVVNNSDELIEEYLSNGNGHFNAMTGGKINSTELFGALINTKDNFVDGIKFAQGVIDGSASILILKNDGKIIAARDKYGRTPIHIGKNDDGYCASFESFACQKVGYELERELGPGEVVEFDSKELKQLAPPEKEMADCSSARQRDRRRSLLRPPSVQRRSRPLDPQYANEAVSAEARRKTAHPQERFARVAPAPPKRKRIFQEPTESTQRGIFRFLRRSPTLDNMHCKGNSALPRRAPSH